MKTKTKLLFLGILGGIFEWIWIGFLAASAYFLYTALVDNSLWTYPLWSLVAGFIARYLGGALDSSRQQVDYVDQVVVRGYTQADARMAWYTACHGGSNMLLSLKQAENIVDIHRLNTGCEPHDGNVSDSSRG